MNRLAQRSAATLLAILLGIPALQAATLEGRWKLVEERAGSGRANRVSPEAPLRLEFFLAGAALEGRVWTAENPSRAFPWPSFGTDRGPLPIQIESRSIAPAGDAARAVYRTRNA